MKQKPNFKLKKNEVFEYLDEFGNWYTVDNKYKFWTKDEWESVKNGFAAIRIRKMTDNEITLEKALKRKASYEFRLETIKEKLYDFRYVVEQDKNNITNIPLDEYGVHQSHCCFKHGCKYGENEQCPVTLAIIKQNYPCEYCHDGEFYN